LPGQYLFVALVFGIIVLLRYRSTRLSGKQLLRLIICGTFGFGVTFCLFETVQASNSSFAVTMLYQSVWMSLAFDCLLSRKLPTSFMLVAGLMVIVGMPMATGLLSSGGGFNLAGILWGLGAAVCYVGMIWTSARFAAGIPPIVRTFVFGLTQLVLASFTSPQYYTGAIFDPGSWLYAIPLGISTGLIPVLIIMQYSPQVPSSISTIMLGMEIPSTVVLEMLVLHRAPDAVIIAGSLLICIGIVVANKNGFAELRKAKE
jgi:drug/metabolite transporter (DMT)-like permease